MKMNDIKYVCSLCPEIKKYIDPCRRIYDIQIDIMNSKERKKYKKNTSFYHGHYCCNLLIIFNGDHIIKFDPCNRVYYDTYEVSLFNTLIIDKKCLYPYPENYTQYINALNTKNKIRNDYIYIYQHLF